MLPSSRVPGGVMDEIDICINSQDPIKMSFKLKLCSFVSVPSSFKKEMHIFYSFDIE